MLHFLSFYSTINKMSNLGGSMSMSKISVVVANSNSAESVQWSKQLLIAGHNVIGECTDIPILIDFLSQHNVNMIMCSVNLINGDMAKRILKLALNFFPSVHIVLIGYMDLNFIPYLVRQMSNFTYKKIFNTDIESIYTPSQIPIPDSLSEETTLKMLLSDHFYSNEKCAEILYKSMPSAEPSYVVFCILTEAYSDLLYKEIAAFIKQYNVKLICNYSISEIYFVLDKVFDNDRIFAIADELRLHLLKKTNITFSIGCSRKCVNPAFLSSKRKEAYTAANSSFLYGRDSVVHIDYIDYNEFFYAYPKHKEEKMITDMLDGNTKSALVLLDQIFDFIRKSDSVDQITINRITLRIWSEMNIMASSRLKALSKTVMDTMPFGKILTIKTPEASYSMLKEGMIAFSTEMNDFYNIKRDALYLNLAKAKQKDKDITISQLTKIFHTTVNFLNQALMQNTNHTVFEFFDE